MEHSSHQLKVQVLQVYLKPYLKKKTTMMFQIYVCNVFFIQFLPAQLGLDNRLTLRRLSFCRSNELGSSSMRIIPTIRCYLCARYDSWKQS